MKRRNTLSDGRTQSKGNVHKITYIIVLYPSGILQ